MKEPHKKKRILFDDSDNNQRIEQKARQLFAAIDRNDKESVAKILNDQDASAILKITKEYNNQEKQGSYDPLTYAVLTHKNACIMPLIKNGANIENRDNGSAVAALALAVAVGNSAAAEKLIHSGADVEQLQKVTNFTVMDTAIIYKQKEMQDLLEKNGARTRANAPLPNGWADEIKKEKERKRSGIRTYL